MGVTHSQHHSSVDQAADWRHICPSILDQGLDLLDLAHIAGQCNCIDSLSLKFRNQILDLLVLVAAP